MSAVNQSSTPPNFEKWMAEHPEFSAKHIVRENENWGKLICEWTEEKKVTNAQGEEQIKKITHIFSATINLKTGEVYMDCRRRKIEAKHASMLVARPLLTAVKTLYHLSMYRVVKQIYKAAIGKPITEDDGRVIARIKTPWREARKKIFRNIADIVRTPAYGTALLAINAAAVALIPLSPKRAYDMRALHGRVEKSLHWGKTHTDWTLGRCFQSGFKVDEQDSDKFIFNKLDEKKNHTNYAGIDAKYDPMIRKVEDERDLLKATRDSLASKYEWEEVHKLDKPIAEVEEKLEKLKYEKLTEIRLANFASSMIKDRRRNYNPFYQLVGTMDPNRQYASSNLARVGKEERQRVLANLKFYIDKVNARFKNLQPEKGEDKAELKRLVGHIKANLDLIASEITDEKARGVGEDKLAIERKKLVEAGVKIVRKTQGRHVGFTDEAASKAKVEQEKVVQLPRRTEVLGVRAASSAVPEKKSGGPDPRSLSALILQETPLLKEILLHEAKIGGRLVDETSLGDLVKETFEAAFDKAVAKASAEDSKAFSKSHLPRTIAKIKEDTSEEFSRRLQELRKGVYELEEHPGETEEESRLASARKRGKRSKESSPEDKYAYLPHEALSTANDALQKAYRSKEFDRVLETELKKLSPQKHHRKHPRHEAPRISSRLPKKPKRRSTAY